MLSLDPRMTPQEMRVNLNIQEHAGEEEVVSLDDILIVISKLEREIEDHKATKMILKRSDEKIAALQAAARTFLDLPF